MSKLAQLWRQYRNWLIAKRERFAGPSVLSSGAHVREWHRRQVEALRAAHDSQADRGHKRTGKEIAE